MKKAILALVLLLPLQSAFPDELPVGAFTKYTGQIQLQGNPSGSSFFDTVYEVAPSYTNDCQTANVGPGCHYQEFQNSPPVINGISKVNDLVAVDSGTKAGYAITSGVGGTVNFTLASATPTALPSCPPFSSPNLTFILDPFIGGRSKARKDFLNFNERSFELLKMQVGESRSGTSNNGFGASRLLISRRH